MAKAQYKTKQMAELISYLKKEEGRHVTVSEISDYFTEKGISVGTTTIYRNLEKMVEEGIVQNILLMEQAVHALSILVMKSMYMLVPVIIVNAKSAESLYICSAMRLKI